MDDDVMMMTTMTINGANNKMVSAITGRSVHDEARQEGKTYDLIAGMRATRMRWMGKILCMEDDRMVAKAVRMMFNDRKEGDLLMDTPAASSWQELQKMVKADKGKR